MEIDREVFSPAMRKDMIYMKSCKTLFQLRDTKTSFSTEISIILLLLYFLILYYSTCNKVRTVLERVEFVESIVMCVEGKDRERLREANDQ